VSTPARQAPPPPRSRPQVGAAEERLRRPVGRPASGSRVIVLTDAAVGELAAALRERAAAEWGPPIPLARSPGLLPAFPVDALPMVDGRMVTAVAEFAQVPADLPSALALGVLADCASGRVVVEAPPGLAGPGEPVPARLLTARDPQVRPVRHHDLPAAGRRARPGAGDGAEGDRESDAELSTASGTTCSPRRSPPPTLACVACRTTRGPTTTDHRRRASVHIGQRPAAGGRIMIAEHPGRDPVTLAAFLPPRFSKSRQPKIESPYPARGGIFATVTGVARCLFRESISRPEL
jgi:hypothetical protein